LGEKKKEDEIEKRKKQTAKRHTGKKKDKEKIERKSRYKRIKRKKEVFLRLRKK